MKAYILLFFYLIFIVACQHAEHRSAVAPNFTALFIDRSDDEPFTQEQQGRILQKLRPVISQCFEHPKDQVEVYFISPATGSKELVSRFVLQLPPLPEHFQELDERQQGREVQKQNTALQTQRELLLGIIKKALSLPPTKGAQAGSDVWSTLRISAELFGAVDSSVTRRVLYVSDMVENTPNSRNFYKTPLQSEQEAVEMGQQDAARMVDRWAVLKANKALKGASVKVIHPRNLLEGKRSQTYVYRYWQTIFQKLEADFDME